MYICIYVCVYIYIYIYIYIYMVICNEQTNVPIKMRMHNNKISQNID